MKKYARYILTVLLCAAIMLGVMLPAAAPVEAAVISGKTGIGMAEWALRAYREGWDYVYGGSSAGAVDCSGLIRSYCNGKGGGAKALLDASSVKGGMTTIPRVHGLGLWMDGHAGVYVGRDENGVDMVVDARNAKKDMQYDELYGNTWPVWVKWYKINMVSYPTTGWYEFDGNTYYYHKGEFVVGYFTVDGITYDFGKSGAYQGVASEVAENVNTVTITSNGINIRSGAGTSNGVIAYSKTNVQYVCLGTKVVSGLTWYNIIYSGAKQGWISGNYVRVNQQTETESTAPVVAEKRLKVTGDPVNVRAGAGTSYDKITKVGKNDEFVYTDTAKASNGVTWYKIKLSSTESGWICGSYIVTLDVSTGTAPTTAPTTPPADTVTSDTDISGTDTTTTATSTTATTASTTVSTTESTTASTTETTASTTTTAATTTTTTAATTAAQKKIQITGSPVNVRSGAGTSYSVITKVYKGATYVYTATKTVSGKKWYKIIIGSKTGWVMGTLAKVVTTTATTAAATTTTTTRATTAAQKKVQITGSVVNVRKGAGTGYAVVTTVKKGATYVYTDTKTVSGKVWYKITVGSKTGWVIGTYAKKI